MDHYHTGHLANGNQILMGVQRPEFVAIEFDRQGEFEAEQTRRFLEEIIGDVRDEFTRRPLLTEEMGKWQQEIGYVPGTIILKEFFLPDRWIGIRDLPDHYQAVLDRPDDLDAVVLHNMQSEILA